mmetsp:Transcript_10284/g.21109  ORF Transcript_10284/g.21109 Transcript_10284/m.21109 type:complete len:207 (+) Transcript_10284:110-730(+)
MSSIIRRFSFSALVSGLPVLARGSSGGRPCSIAITARICSDNPAVSARIWSSLAESPCTGTGTGIGTGAGAFFPAPPAPGLAAVWAAAAAAAAKPNSVAARPHSATPRPCPSAPPTPCASPQAEGPSTSRRSPHAATAETELAIREERTPCRRESWTTIPRFRLATPAATRWCRRHPNPPPLRLSHFSAFVAASLWNQVAGHEAFA